MSLPYQGNKSVIAQDLLVFLKQSFTGIDNFYDLFGGGGSISKEAVKHYDFVHYNEKLPHIYYAVNSLINGTFDAILPKSEWISREEFFKIRDSEPTTEYKYACKGLILTCWSFGNNQTSYIYGKDIEEWKEALHIICFTNSKEDVLRSFETMGKRVFYDSKQNPYTLIFDESKADYLLSIPFGSERRYNLKKCVLNRESLERLERLERLESLQRLQSLQSLERLQSLQSLETSNLSYEEVEIKPNSLLYCDIPYRTEAGLKKKNYGTDLNTFCDSFYKWALENENPVVFSEYEENVPADFKIIWRKNKRNILSAQSNKKMSTEVLAWNGKGCFINRELF